MIWKLIKEFMRETEHANNIRFDNSAWDRAKKLESDIEKFIYRNYEDRIEPIRDTPPTPASEVE